MTTRDDRGANVTVLGFCRLQFGWYEAVMIDDRYVIHEFREDEHGHRSRFVEFATLGQITRAWHRLLPVRDPGKGFGDWVDEPPYSPPYLFIRGFSWCAPS